MSASPGIRSKAASLVKRAALASAAALLVVFATISAPAHAQDNTVAPPIDAAPDVGAPTIDTTTPPPGSVQQTPTPDEDEDGGAEAMIVEEVKEFDPYSQWLTGAFGFFRNAGVGGKSSSYFAGGGVRYGVTLFSRFLADSNRVQDSLAIEAGVFYYAVVNFATTGDAYTVIPLIGTLRYNLSFSDNLTLFFYGGWYSNYAMMSSSNSADTDSTRVALSLQSPAAGVGFIYRIGPNWDVRADVGTDSAQLGLMLRF